MDIGKVVKVNQLRRGDEVDGVCGARVVSSVQPGGNRSPASLSFADRCIGEKDVLHMSPDEYVMLLRRPLTDPGRILRSIFDAAHDLKDHEPDITQGEDPAKAYEAIGKLHELCETYLLSLPTRNGAV